MTNSRKGTEAIHLWIFKYSEYTGPNYLDKHERSRADSFKYPLHKDRFIERRSCLKYLLGNYQALEPDTLTLEISAYGKPSLKNSSIAFNSSNSEEFYIICFQKARTIGCDIEKNVTQTDFHEIAKLVFSPEEQIMLQNTSYKKKMFYSIWSRKEAFIKADGKGISYGLSNFTVEGRPHMPVKVLSSLHEKSFQLISVDTILDYSIAICHEEGESPPKLEIFTAESWQ